MRELSVRVVPDSKTNSVIEKSGRLTVSVTEPADNGRANQQLIQVLAEYLEIPAKNIVIIRGTTSPSKIIRIY